MPIRLLQLIGESRKPIYELNGCEYSPEKILEYYGYSEQTPEDLKVIANRELDNLYFGGFDGGKIEKLRDRKATLEESIEKNTFLNSYKFWTKDYWKFPFAADLVSILSLHVIAKEAAIGFGIVGFFQGFKQFLMYTIKSRDKFHLKKTNEFIAEYDGVKDILEQSEVIQIVPDRAKEIQRQIYEDVGKNPYLEINYQKANEDLRKIYDEARERYLVNQHFQYQKEREKNIPEILLNPAR